MDGMDGENGWMDGFLCLDRVSEIEWIITDKIVKYINEFIIYQPFFFKNGHHESRDMFKHFINVKHVLTM